MFAVAGLIVAKVLPRDATMKICGLPNRWFIAVAASVFCVVIELLLNGVNALTWDYWWWNARAPWLKIVFGYLQFFVVAFWVHDMPSVSRKAGAVGTIFAVDAVALILFVGVLGWI